MTLSCFVTRNLRTSIFLSPTVKHTLDGHTPQICQKTEFFRLDFYFFDSPILSNLIAGWE